MLIESLLNSHKTPPYSSSFRGLWEAAVNFKFNQQNQPERRDVNGGSSGVVHQCQCCLAWSLNQGDQGHGQQYYMEVSLLLV